MATLQPRRAPRKPVRIRCVECFVCEEEQPLANMRSLNVALVSDNYVRKFYCVGCSLEHTKCVQCKKRIDERGILVNFNVSVSADPELQQHKRLTCLECAVFCADCCAPTLRVDAVVPRAGAAAVGAMLCAECNDELPSENDSDSSSSIVGGAVRQRHAKRPARASPPPLPAQKKQTATRP